MTDDTLFTGQTRTAGAAFGVGCIAGLAAVVGVVGVVSGFMLLSGQAMTPSLASTVTIATPVGLAVAVALGVWAFRVHDASARTLTLRRGDGDELVLEIEPDIVCRGKITFEHGWQTGLSHGAARTKLLWCDVACDGRFVLRLSHEIGSLHPLPDGWPRASLSMDHPSLHGGFALSGLPRLVEVMRSHAGDRAAQAG